MVTVADAPEDFPMTVEAVYAYRGRIRPGERTPFSPVAQGEPPWLCFASRGFYEWFMHPADAAHCLEHGILVEGKQLRCELTNTPFYPWIGAWQIRAVDDRASGVFMSAAA